MDEILDLVEVNLKCLYHLVAVQWCILRLQSSGRDSHRHFLPLLDFGLVSMCRVHPFDRVYAVEFHLDEEKHGDQPGVAEM